jgi:hypothetical protein
VSIPNHLVRLTKTELLLIYQCQDWMLKE